MLHKEIKYSYDDITICPEVVSKISHRSECNPTLYDGNLPIFASPMSTVVDTENYGLFKKNGIIPILPRTERYSVKQRLDYASKGQWAAFSLSEFKERFNTYHFKEGDICYKVLIDIANGHMSELFNSVKGAKEKYGDNLIVMIGNIANPQTYIQCCECGADYCRFSIGSGLGCITTSQTGIHYPIASLINEAYDIKRQYAFDNKLRFSKLPKIVADGGIRGYRDVIKALALGADYVMIGSEFAKLIESAAPIYTKEDNGVLDSKCLTEYRSLIRENDGNYTINATEVIDIKGDLYKKFYGMASKQGQIDMNGKKTKTSEGVCKEIKVTTNIDKWVENMKDYLKSAMSYLSITKVSDLNPIMVETYLLSENAKNSINK